MPAVRGGGSDHVEVEVERQPAGAQPVAQPVQIVQARRRPQPADVVVSVPVVEGAQHVDEAPHLGHRLPSAVDHAGQHGMGRVVVGQGAADGAGLHDEQADVVPDGVVQFPGDPHAFGQHGLVGQQQSFPLRLLGPL